MDIQIRSDLQRFCDFVVQSDAEWINSHQDFVLMVIALIANEHFHKRIDELRVKYDIPTVWYTDVVDPDKYESELLDWLEKHHTKSGYSVPIESGREIADICSEFGVDLEHYGFYVFNYLYLGDVRVNPDNVGYGQFNNNFDDFRYKCSLKFLEKGQVLESDSRGIYIRLYKDTTINKLREFIEDKKDVIRDLQNKLDIGSYPPTKGFSERFRRDVEIYLLSLLGMKAPQIADVLNAHIDQLEDNDPAYNLVEELYSLEEGAIRQVILDMGTRIKRINISK